MNGNKNRKKQGRLKEKEENTKKGLKINWKLLRYFLGIYIGLAILFYWIAEEAILYQVDRQEALVQTKEIGEIVDGDVVEQIIHYKGDFLSSLTFQVATYARKNTGTIRIAVSNQPFDLKEKTVEEAEIVIKEYDMATITDNSNLIVEIGKKTDGLDWYIRITSKGASYGNAITFYATETFVTDQQMYRNGQAEAMALCIGVDGGIATFLGNWYWELVLVTGGVLILVFFFMFQEGEERLGNRLLSHIRQYKFLVNQLVKRDFKAKYKRSALGFFWSFLNPLLTMLVQYVVFSTIFRSDIDNFPVYLLSAGIVFNFFTESVGGGLCAIVGNAALITKVYVPKYIYPFSKVLSTAINLVISMLPLLFAVWVTGEQITRAFLLLPFFFLCLLAFCVGMSLMLSTSMVFFRDTQFLWGILSLVWMYATPIFYPESIIPARFRFVLQINPMYHYLKFFRTILMQGVSPQMIEYGYCIGFALLFLGTGAWIFRRAQKKFVLYL